MKNQTESTSEPNPLTKLFPISIAGYVWQLHEWWIGVIVGIIYIAVNIGCNVLYISKYMANSKDPIRGFQRIKWVLFAIFMIGTAFSGASIGQVQ